MTTCILKKNEIAAMEGTHKVHFLNENGVRTNKSLGDLTGLSGFGFHLIEVPPGRDSTEYHVHYYEDECVYILSGCGSVQIGDESFDVAEGDFIGYPAGGEAHCMTNTGTEPLKCIVVGERLDHDVATYPDKKKRIYRNKGMAWEVVDLDKIDRPNAGAK